MTHPEEAERIVNNPIVRGYMRATEILKVVEIVAAALLDVEERTRAEERERCAKIAERPIVIRGSPTDIQETVNQALARAIRGKGE